MCVFIGQFCFITNSKWRGLTITIFIIILISKKFFIIFVVVICCCYLLLLFVVAIVIYYILQCTHDKNRNMNTVTSLTS